MENYIKIKPKIWMKTIASILTVIFIFQFFPAIVFGVQSYALQESDSVVENDKDNSLNSNTGIVGEIIEKRTLNEKHFLQEDGNIIATIYPSNIHYEENGQLLDIDNSLEESTEDEGLFKNKSNSFEVKFTKKSNNNNLVKLKIKGHNIKWSMQNSNKVNATKIDDNGQIEEKFKLKNISSGIIEYEDILEGIDLQYNVISNSIKENIILKDKTSIEEQIVFEFNTDNLKMEKTDDGRIIFSEEGKEEVLFFLEAPFMYDSKNEMSNDIEVKLEGKNNKYTLTLLPNREWLEDETREYPITIDPTVETSLNYQNIQDTYIFNGDTGYPNRYAAHILRVGSNNTLASKNPIRSLIKFTLPELNAGDQVISAMLDICSYPDTNEWTPPSQKIQIDVHKMTQDWTDSTASWTSLSTKYDTRIADYTKYQYDSNNPAKFYYFDITSIVKDWYVTGNNYGLVLKEHTEIYNLSRSDVYFYSADVNAAYINARPMVQIVYRNQTGLESYQTYHTQNVGRAGTVYTNDYNGNLTLLHHDFSTPGQNLSVSVNHVYNTNDKNVNIGYGNGYRLNISQTIEKVTIGSKEYARYTDEDGTKHYFEKQGSSYIDSENLGLELTFENEKFTLKDKSNNKFIFDKKTNTAGQIWFLKQLVDSYNNITNIQLINDSTIGARVSSITDSAGDTINFSYSNNRLSQITDSASRTLKYEYDTSGNLIKITYSDGKYSQYTYTNKLLTSVKNIDNYHMNYEYYNEKSNRVKAIKEYSIQNEIGSYLNISYGNNITKFTDNKGYSNTYTFNNYGQTISLSDFGKNPNDIDNAFGKMYQYGENQKDKNRLTLEGNLYSIAEKGNNLIVNGNFANGLQNWSKANCDSNDQVVNGSFKFVGNSDIDKNLGQTVNVSGNKGDIFTLATWVNSKAVPNNSDRRIKVSLTIHFTRADGTLQVINKKVNVDGSGWQFKSEVVITDSDYISAKVYLVCSYNENETYFDNVALFKEEFGQSYTYDDNGNIVSIQDNSETNQTFKYDTNNNLITAINPKGGKFNYEYDTYNPKKLNNATNAAGNKYSFQYDSYGNIITSKVEENSGNNVDLQYQTHVSYEGWNEEVSNGEQSGDLEFVNQIEAIKINLISDVPNSNIEYQAHVSEIGWQNYVQGGNVAGTIGESLPIEAVRIKLVNLPNYSVKYKTYVEGLGWQDWVKDGELSGTTGLAKKIYAIQIKVEYVNSNNKYIQTSAEYSTNGNYQTKLIDEVGNSTQYEYNLTKGILTKVTDAKNSATTYEYDNLNRITKVSKQVNSKNYNNTYTYENDAIKTITHNGFSYSFIYDNFGNVKQTKVGNQLLSTNNYAENNGNLSSQVYGNNQTISYNYDRFNRLTKLTGTNGNYQYTYDAESNVKTIIDSVNNNTQSFTYDLANRLVKETNTNGFTSEYGYDINNNISTYKYTLTSKANSLQYNYDKANRLTSLKLNNNISWLNTMDKLSRLTNRKITSGTNTYTTNYIYTDVSNVTNKTTTLLKTIQNGNSDIITYTYDALGNIETIKKGSTLTNKYYYDELSQLIREDSVTQNKTITYEYDVGGNILNKKEYTYTTSSSLPSTANKTITYAYGNTNWKDQLTKYNGKTITYDAIGNTLTYDGNTYTWQNGRQLAGISNTTKNQTITYKYNDSGIRTQKTLNGTTTDYYLDGTKVIYEKTGSNIIYYTYDENGLIIGLKYNDTQYYYIKNGQNDIIGILDGNLNQIVSYEYNSWGNVISIKDASGNNITSSTHIGIINPYRYRSYRYDTETGLYYLQSRYYSPEWGRFLNSDAILDNTNILGVNLYLYCGNNPVNNIDPMGDAWWNVFRIIKKATIAIKNFISLSTSYENTAVSDAKGGYNATTTIKDITYNYKINSDGSVALEFKENPRYYIGVAPTLSRAVLENSKQINHNNMLERTAKGIEVELNIHYIGYLITKGFDNGQGFISRGMQKLNKRFSPANMGGFNVDNNAIIFEYISMYVCY